jgi:hypothetical protein
VSWERGYQTPKIVKNVLDGLGMENVGIFYCHLEYVSVIWSILLPFGQFYCHLVYFVAFWCILWSFGIYCGPVVFFSLWLLHQDKSCNPGGENWYMDVGYIQN